MGALPAETILRELASLWVTQGKEGEGAGVLRACTMTLVVLADQGDDATALGETLAALMPEHPARTIVIRLTGADGGAIEQHVFAQCWRPFGQRRQICSEQIEIGAPDRALEGLPRLVLPLAAADLPVVMWCRSGRLAAREEFTGIASLAHKLIVDSKTMGADGLRTVADLAGRGLVADLCWTRLTRWREMLAQLFENRDSLAQLGGVERVTTDFAGEGSAINWYMGAWILDALATIGIRPNLSAGGSGSPVPVVLEGAGLRLEMSRQEDRMVVSLNDLSHCTSLSPATDYLLMREELGILRRDPVFERTLASAVRLADAEK
jgi:glucose-6-phosphate dehydrogenase assembly protein OpcA